MPKTPETLEKHKFGDDLFADRPARVYPHPQIHNRLASTLEQSPYDIARKFTVLRAHSTPSSLRVKLAGEARRIKLGGEDIKSESFH